MLGSDIGHWHVVDMARSRRRGAGAAAREELVELRRGLRVAKPENEVRTRATASFASQHVRPT